MYVCDVQLYTVYTLQLYLYWKLKVSGLLKQFVVIINKHLVFTEMFRSSVYPAVSSAIINIKGEIANIFF